MHRPHLGIFGAGSIGRFLGTHLSAAGWSVTMVGRSRSPASLALPVLQRNGARVHPGPGLAYTTDIRELAGVDLCLVTVKAQDTQSAAFALSSVLSPATVVVSFQNGLAAAQVLQAHLHAPVAAGVVSFNVRADDWGCIRQTTSGELFVERIDGREGEAVQDLACSLRAAGLRVKVARDMQSVQAGKLLLNLNNGVCAATGMSIAASIRSQPARWCFAACVDEARRVCKAARLRPAQVGPIPPGLLATVLRLPNAIVSWRAAQLGDDARSSTLQDLERGKATTEIDHLNGAIVDLARRHGVSAPINALVTEIVHQHERAVLDGRAPRFVSAELLQHSLREVAGDAAEHGSGDLAWKMSEIASRGEGHP